MIYELRSYFAHPGKMGALQKRFRDHTCKLFEKHGITNVGYWTNSIGGRNDELIYILGFQDLAQRDAAWAASRRTRTGAPPPNQRRTARWSTTSRTGFCDRRTFRRCGEGERR